MADLKSTSKEYDAILEAIVQRRQELGLSQKKYADQIGVSQGIIGRIEARHSIPSVETLINLIRPLGLTLVVQEIEPENKT